VRPLRGWVALGVVTLCAHARAEEPYVAGACSADIMASEAWEGEYPGPSVDVRRPVTVPGFAHPCDAAATLNCKLVQGVYHPWSTTTRSRYLTVQAVHRYRARTPVTVTQEDASSRVLPAGTIVSVPVYLGENICAFELGDLRWTAECPDDAGWDNVYARPEGSGRKLFLADCDGGRAGWVEVDASLMTRPEVREGAILEYGVAEPAPP
jgi:hypothetical protein